MNSRIFHQGNQRAKRPVGKLNIVLGVVDSSPHFKEINAHWRGHGGRIADDKGTVHIVRFRPKGVVISIEESADLVEGGVRLGDRPVEAGAGVGHDDLEIIQHVCQPGVQGRTLEKIVPVCNETTPRTVRNVSRNQ